MMYARGSQAIKFYQLVRNGMTVLQEATASEFQSLLDRENVKYQTEKKVEGLVHFRKIS